MPGKKQASLKERLERIWKGDKSEREGYELSAEGQEVRTPSAGEFLGNLDKLTKPTPEAKPD